MDDFVISNLQESRNEWCSRLISIFTPLVNEGVRSIFNEAWKLCVDNDEANKYLMTFQNLLSRVPKWNNVIIEEERKRIIERSGCNYLEDLITCVHIIQLKVLTCIRVGNKQKKIDITIPKLDTFIHKVYINVARKIYSNVFLFEKNINPLQMQKNNREFETIIQECILLAIRDSIPTESIIRAYMEESVEQEEEVFIEPVPEEAVKVETKSENEVDATSIIVNEESIPETVPAIKNIDEEQVVTRLTFNEIDSVMDDNNVVKSVSAPKNIERLEEISSARAMQRRLDEEEESEERIKITGDTIDLSGFDVLDNDKVDILSNEFMLDGIEELV
uniref:Uncharacterized protein n=1 Tax=viral metagenome TaxID=1070528 RepID=A0A6C0B8L6_9ZZZZ